jgi:hypothetical protein
VGPPASSPFPPFFCSRLPAERRDSRGGLPPPAIPSRTGLGNTASHARRPAQGILTPPPFPNPSADPAHHGRRQTWLSHGGRRCQGRGAPNWAAREHHQRSLSEPQP